MGIFDYLMQGYFGRAASLYDKWKSMLIAGNPCHHKAGYAYHLPNDMPVHLYGVGYNGKITDFIRYHGSFPQEELLNVLEGGFGLVWDGDRLNKCSGVYGEYLRYNNSYKMSMYLALGIPVIIWEEAVHVREFGCGFTVRSIPEIKERLDNMTLEKYRMYRKNVEREGSSLRM